MAKLETTNAKYGVSIGARIDTEVAHQIAERAENLGISMAQMVNMLVTKGLHDVTPEPVDNSEEIDELFRLYTNTMAQFIEQISFSKEEKRNYVEHYNELLEQNRDD